jgi:hypothetical protein
MIRKPLDARRFGRNWNLVHVLVHTWITNHRIRSKWAFQVGPANAKKKERDSTQSQSVVSWPSTTDKGEDMFHLPLVNTSGNR